MQFLRDFACDGKEQLESCKPGAMTEAFAHGAPALWKCVLRIRAIAFRHSRV